MTIALNLADLFFLQTQVNLGWFQPPGTDPFSLLGLRAVDGTNNNLIHQTIVDQYGNTVDTDTFANVNQPFFHMVAKTSPSPYDPQYTRMADVVDSSPRIISNLVADQTNTNPAFVLSQAEAVRKPRRARL